MAEGLEKFLYTRKEAAQSLGLSVRSIDYLMSRRELDFRQVGGKKLIPRESLRLFARKNHFDLIKPPGVTKRGSSDE